MNLIDASSAPVTLVGIDLAWGEVRPDGISVLHFENGILEPITSAKITLSQGDESLFSCLDEIPSQNLVLAAIDAPVVGPNLTGSRPVDRACSRLFRKEEAGCHPVNRSLCVRPFRIAEQFAKRGFAITSDISRASRLLTEVYPHPAMIRWFDLSKTIKYKKGRVAERHREYQRYQDHFQRFLESQIPELLAFSEIQNRLNSPWSKNEEDQLDSLFSAMIGWWHLRHEGKQSEVLGDDSTGFILIPNPSSNLVPLT